MLRRWFVPTALIAAALVLVAAFVGAERVTSVRAQGSPTAMAGMASTSHPAHIHNGTCSALGDVVYPLNNVAPAGESATPMSGTDATAMAGVKANMVAGMMATPTTGMTEAGESYTVINASLDQITGGNFAINVHESAANIQNYIACGDITGTPSNNQLVVQLNPLNNSGFAGQAHLMDNGDGTTSVAVVLFQGMMSAATPIP